MAEALFEQGRAAMDKGDLDHACPMLAESERLDPGGGTLLNLALCHDRQGRIATAWAEYKEALSVAIRDGRNERRDFAKQRIDALEPRLPRLVVAPPQEVLSGLQISVDDKILVPELYGGSYPVDPGAHRVVARAPGRVTWSITVNADERATANARVPMLVPLAAAAPDKARFATASWVFGAVALAGVGVTAAAGGVALAADSEARSKCIASRDFCSDIDGETAASRAKTAAWVSTGGLGVAVVATVVAIAWPREKAAVARVGVSATPSERGGAIHVRGEF